MKAPKPGTVEYARMQDDPEQGRYLDLPAQLGPIEPSPRGLPGMTVMRELRYWVMVELYNPRRGAFVYGYRVWELSDPSDILSPWRPWFRVQGETTNQAQLRARKGIRKRLIEGERPTALVPHNPKLMQLHDYWRAHGSHMLAQDVDEIGAGHNAYNPRTMPQKVSAT